MSKLDYETWVRCALAYAKARGITDLATHAEEQRVLHRQGESPATYVERAFADRLRKGSQPEA